MLKGKDFGKDPKNLTGNMQKAHGMATPPSAVGRDGGAPGKQIPDQVVVTKVPKSSLHRNMP